MLETPKKGFQPPAPGGGGGGGAGSTGLMGMSVTGNSSMEFTGLVGGGVEEVESPYLNANAPPEEESGPMTSGMCCVALWKVSERKREEGGIEGRRDRGRKVGGGCKSSFNQPHISTQLSP